MMKYKSFDHMDCSLAQTLDVIGERWTLLILRDIFFGVKRFSQFEKSLDIAKNILAVRLNRLVDEGILLKQSSNEGSHPEYKLTDKGLDLQPILLSMTHWGDKHKPNSKGQRLIFVENRTGQPIRTMSVVSKEGKKLNPREVKATLGPGLSDTWPFEPTICQSDF
ncbi:MAG: helix-turn-helix transcriptional regulator [Pseudomonadales bacterium]|nr:helix-turn-helix transcriptional regulator [Pseudomonadales bacterium]